MIHYTQGFGLRRMELEWPFTDWDIAGGTVQALLLFVWVMRGGFGGVKWLCREAGVLQFMGVLRADTT